MSAAVDRVVTGRLEDGTYLVSASGELDEPTTRLLVGEIERIAGGVAIRIVIDVTRAGMLDRAAVGELRAVATGVDAPAARIVFVSDHPRALRDLRGEIGNAPILNAERTVTEALASATLGRTPPSPSSGGR
jgi:anti-anti-sigma regulatory factor